uniref:Uncharacterized protein n=1 Tax=Trichobilharzia regenti TaxID=157069 RepID=A0AA85KL53_TRIRE|nr:unnamed protein product [Trichobilharzia regenti]
MTAVWTATSLRRQDSRYNSLSRSLGSLMSVVLDEEKSPSVLIFSNQSSRISSEDNLRASSSVGDRVGGAGARGDDGNIPFKEPNFSSLQTDSSSSIAFIGKKIKREYQSAFVLPDRQTIGVVRQEAFMTEEGLAEVTLSLCVGNNPENLRVGNSERICDYLDSDYWASILLASTESHDAELLGYMGPEYTCRRPNRFNFERSESRRRKREIVLVQEEFEPHNKPTGEHFSGVNILPETIRVFEKIKDKEEDEFTPQKMPSTPPSSSRPQTPKSPKSTSPRASIQPGEPPSPKPQKIPSKITNQSKDQAPIIGRAEPPGKTKAIISSPKSKENFEELKRQWNNRIAKMQERMDNQYKDAPTTPSQTYTEGHRGTVITSILPTVDNRKSNDSIAKSRTPPSEHRRTPSDQSYELPQQQPQKQQSLPERMSSAYHRANKENLLFNHFDPTSPGSGFSDPVTERCEKDAQFVYNEERLYVNQQNIGRLSPRTPSEIHPISNMTKFRSRSLEHYYVEEYITNRRASDENITKELNNFQTSMSLLIDKDDSEESSKQTYIYQSTLSRLPVTIKNLDSCHDSTISNNINHISETRKNSERYTKHELFVCRKPTYYFNIPPAQKSQTFPKHTSRTEVKLHPHSPSTPSTTTRRTPLGYYDKFEMIIRVNDSHSTSDREDDIRRKTPRQRMYTSLPRTRHALLYYPQPGSPGLMLDSPVSDKSQTNYHPSASIKHGSTDPPHYRKARYPNSYFRKDDQPSIDRKEKFLRKYEKTKASSEINYTIHNRNNNNKILSDINQSLSNDYYQYYQSSTDISSVLSREGDVGGGDSLKIYLNRYVERSEKHWSLPRSHHLLLNDDSAPRGDRISEQSEFSDNLSKDVGSNDEKAEEEKEQEKKDLKLPRKVAEDSRKSLKSPSADSLSFYFLEPYKRYTDNRKQDDYSTKEVKKISQKDEEEEEEKKDNKEKANIDDILNQAYQDEMNRMKKRQHSIKKDNYGSTSSLGVLVKKYEDQVKINTFKDTERKSNSMKNRKSQPDDKEANQPRPVEPMKPTDEASKPRDDTSRIKHKDPPSYRYLPDITSGGNKQQPETPKTTTTDLPKKHSRTADDKGKHQASIDSPEPFNKPTPVPHTPKVLEKPDRMSKSLDKKSKPSDQSNTNEGDTNASNNNNTKPRVDRFIGEKAKSQEPESKHQHRYPPPPPQHHRTSTKHDDDDGNESKHLDKRVNDGPTPFSKFKKDMTLSDRPKPDSRPAPHEETKTFSRDSKFRKPIHTVTEGQTGGNLPPTEKRKSLPGIKETDDRQRKSSKEKSQFGDIKGLNSLQDRDMMLKDKQSKERNRVPEPARSSKSPHQHHRHHSLRVKQYKPYPGFTPKDDRISSWIENSKQQTRRLLLAEEEGGGSGAGEIDPSPELERHRPSLTRHQSLNEERRYSADDKQFSGSGTVKGNEAKNRSKHADQDQSPEKREKKEIMTPKPDRNTDVPKDPISLQAIDQPKRRESDKGDRHRPPSNKPDQDQNSRQETKQPVDRKISDNKQPTDTLNKPHTDQPTTDLRNESKPSPPSKRRHQSREDFKQPKLSSTKPQSDLKDEDHLHCGKDVKHRDKPTPHRSKEPSRQNLINRRRDNTHSPSADREEHRLTPPDREIKVVDDHRPGHKRHPPPPLSPTSKRDIHYPRDATYNQPKTPHDSSQTVPTKHFSKYPGDGDIYDPEGRRRRTRPEQKESPVPSDPRKAKLPHSANGLAKHPDEYNYLAEAEKQKPTADYCTSELSDGSSLLYGKTNQGSTRKQPFKSLDKYKSKDTEPVKPHRHPPPPQPMDHSRSKPKRGDEKSTRKSDRKPDYANENHYMNLPGSIPHGARPPNERNRSLQDLTERSGLHSVYDPRLVDEPTIPYKPQTIDRIPIRQQEPKSPDIQQRSYTSEEDSEDYSDSGGSDEVLKPPALRTIPQTRRQSEPKLPSEDNYPPVQLRRPSSKGLKTPGQLPFDDGIISPPEGMSIPSTPGYENIYDNYNDRTGKYAKGSQYRTSGGGGLSSGILSQERVSRPRSKHTTATSQGSGYYGVSGNSPRSKHSLIISTKRRTFSGVTGTHPSKHRSSSMNTLWFGDHPIPSESTLSPSTPIKLSNIQLQAQAELERRHRSASSQGHSLDRKSNYSGGNTESHLSKGFSESQGYEGVGYAYDSRGRLIHGGACLPERSASRKRRLLDGHESLSRVWIPQAEHYPINQNVTDRTASLLTNRDERQAQLDNSAMAFALKDFNMPKIR